MKRLIIYHSADFDGVFSGAIAKKKYPGAELIGWNHGNDQIDCSEYGKVIVMDLPLTCLKDGVLRKNITWIDHHISAIKDEGDALGIIGLRDTQYAACELAWNFFFGSLPPLPVALAGRYDVWDLDCEVGEIEKGDVINFQKGLQTMVRDPLLIKEVFLDRDQEDIYDAIDEVIKDGGTILEYLKVVDTDLCKCKAFIGEIKGHKKYKAICLNVAGRGSDVFDSVPDEDYDIMLTYNFDGDKWCYSVYTKKDNIDVSVIAKSFGGGGHMKASGFSTKTLVIKKHDEQPDLGRFLNLARSL